MVCKLYFNKAFFLKSQERFLRPGRSTQAFLFATPAHKAPPTQMRPMGGQDHPGPMGYSEDLERTM